MQIQPLNTRVVIEPDAAPKSQGGIALPENITRNGTRIGLVVAVGPGRVLDNGQLVPVAVKVGDRVLFMPFGCVEVGDVGSKLTVVDESDVIGIVK